jgi:hypothetical protein
MLSVPGLEQFLEDYPLMAVRPCEGDGLLLKGQFAFDAASNTLGQITDQFELTVFVSNSFPRALPQVMETKGRIPRNADHHINPDGTLCLGSPLRLLLKLSRDPTITGFAANCLVPYLYAISYKLNSHGPLPFDELAHGLPGILDDCVELFDLRSPAQARSALELLGLKKRRANKRPCPCGCEKRLGRCAFNFKLNPLRKLASRGWFRALLRHR